MSGVVAAVVTPLADGGRKLAERAVGRLVEFYADAGMSGLFVAGTTGEGMLLTTRERMALTESFVAAARGTLAVAVHVGAMTTAEAVALAEHARNRGVDAVAAIGPPYYRYDDDELLTHFDAIASACAPVPLYLYEFRDRTGYVLPVSMIRSLAQRAPNLVGMKVSDRTLHELRSYALPELDLFVGTEALIPDALAIGAAGAVSALASAFPHAVLRIFAGEKPGSYAASLRDALTCYPFQAALKSVLVFQGALDDPSVRAPLRGLGAAEQQQLVAWLEQLGIAGDSTRRRYDSSPAA